MGNYRKASVGWGSEEKGNIRGRRWGRVAKVEVWKEEVEGSTGK